ncbi:hypothetical protein, partial [Enterobacter hormaechei]|uniref:hypothetical protein n=1 Tax=Enterobacter hormaechei TaxID=158836 RepID=UPI0013D7F4BC
AYAESDIIILLLTYQIDNGGLKLSQVTTTRNLAILSPMRGTTCSPGAMPVAAAQQGSLGVPAAAGGE